MTCKSYRNGKTFCADGFPQTLPCWNECGLKGGAIPHCLNENIPKHLITESGAPKYFNIEKATK